MSLILCTLGQGALLPRFDLGIREISVGYPEGISKSGVNETMRPLSCSKGLRSLSNLALQALIRSFILSMLGSLPASIAGRCTAVPFHYRKWSEVDFLCNSYDVPPKSHLYSYVSISKLKFVSSPDQPFMTEDAAMVPYRVFVAGIACDIAVYSKSKAVSIAVGKYKGRQIEVRSASAIGAADAWVKAAERFKAAD
jgi:hypothetical protein